MENPLERPHSRLPASGAERWFNCPGCIRLIKEAPKSVSSVHALRGEAAHWLIEQTYPLMRDAVALSVGTKAPNGVVFDQEDIDAVYTHFKMLDGIMLEDEWVVYTELKGSLPNAHKDLGGTADRVFGSTDKSRVVVVDYKHGVGVPVDVEGNKQLLIYALCVIEKLDLRKTLKSLDIIVDQPRSREGYDGPKRWPVSLLVVLEFEERLRQAAARTDDPKAPLNPGSWCHWCPALSYIKDGAFYECPAVKAKRHDIACSDFTEKSTAVLPKCQEMRIEDVIRALEFKPALDEWWKQAKQLVTDYMIGGGKADGYKMVKAIKHRQWRDPDAALSMANAFYSRGDFQEIVNLKSPSQVEKILGQGHRLADQIHTPEGGLVSVPNSDRRKAVEVSTPEQDFERIES